jgi:hypothetical protein
MSESRNTCCISQATASSVSRKCRSVSNAIMESPLGRYNAWLGKTCPWVETKEERLVISL